MAKSKVFPGADESTPSRAQYFSWINNTNEGATEAQTLANLNFFKWLHDEYGMVLDIYAFDAGAIDGRGFYGSMDSERFKSQFPNGFGLVAEVATQMDTRLGLWGGPDGFGDTPEEEDSRVEMMSGLCRDHNFMLFKFDGVCGQLRPEKRPAFVRMMEECRKHSPDLIALNHRLPLGEEGLKHMTTALLGGEETYIDVFMNNDTTGSHHRVGAISRAPTPGLVRLSEDHGVCISSCADFWDDDLILQAFNRCLILAPEVYGSPWLLRDDEFPKFARIYNLHRRYRDILVNGMELPQKQYGPHAISRGDGSTRFLTLKNLTWKTKQYEITLGKEIGLKKGEQVELRQFHPTERVIGSYAYGETVRVPVIPFRACLLMATTTACPEFTVAGCDYDIIRDTAGKATIIQLNGMPGTSAEISLPFDTSQYSSARIDGQDASCLLDGPLKVRFKGKRSTKPWHRKLADLQRADFPEDAEALYEATVFAADNNALEVRTLERSGKSRVPAVREAQEAFFAQDLFRKRGLWDRFMFNNKHSEWFYPSTRRGIDQRIQGGALRIDFGEVICPDTIELMIPNQHALMPMLEQEVDTCVEVSTDLKSWTQLRFIHGEHSVIKIANGPVRYMRVPRFSCPVQEVNAYVNGKRLSRKKWRGSNLFAPFALMDFCKAWKASICIDEAAKGSYLCVAINGKHGVEGAYAAIRKPDGSYVGAPDRARSYQSNTWEHVNAAGDRNYTYYFPVDKSMLHQDLDVIVLGAEGCSDKLRPQVWITANPIPFESKKLVLE